MKAIRHSSYGNPLDVLILDENPLKQLGPGECRLSVLYSPINPADINMCEGRYSVQPALPCVLGNEGVAIVTECASDVSELKIGQRVICPFQSEDNWLGFWQEELVVHQSNCIVVPDYISDEQAAMLSVNPLTAYLLLTEFAALKRGDWIIQNLANSALGRCVIVLAKKMGLNIVSTLRNEGAVDQLKSLGSDEVIVETERFSVLTQQKGCCKLALNGVGGSSASELAKCLSSKGVMVTYGAMSKQHVTVANALLIYKNIELKGFNRSAFLLSKTSLEIKSMYEGLFSLLTGSFAIPVERIYHFYDYKEAVKHSLRESRQGKVLLRFNET